MSPYSFITLSNQPLIFNCIIEDRPNRALEVFTSFAVGKAAQRSPIIPNRKLSNDETTSEMRRNFSIIAARVVE